MLAVRLVYLKFKRYCPGMDFLRPREMKSFFVAALAMIAFAANSVIARFALSNDGIDPATFTMFRLVAGAFALTIIALFSKRGKLREIRDSGSWSSALLLMLYATTFSYAYVNLGAATGALILFAVVQSVIFSTAVRSGERIGLASITGLFLALAGLVALLGPSLSRPHPTGVLLMSIAGVSWAGYTLRGRGVEGAILVSAGNFLRSVPLVTALWLPLVLLRPVVIELDPKGLCLAIFSGAITSGVGYALWYTVLPSLTHTQSGIVQLAPAPLATLGGLMLLGEPITGKILLATFLILSGVLIGVLKPRRKK